MRARNEPGSSSASRSRVPEAARRASSIRNNGFPPLRVEMRCDHVGRQIGPGRATDQWRRVVVVERLEREVQRQHVIRRAAAR